MTVMLRQTRDGHLVWVQPTDAATLGATNPAPQGAMPPPMPDDPQTAGIVAGQHAAQTPTLTHLAPNHAAAPAPSPQLPWYQRPLVGFGGSDALVNLPAFNPRIDPRHGIMFGPGPVPEAPPAGPAPTPHLDLGTGPTISPEDQRILDLIQPLTTQDYGGTVPNVTLPDYPTITADPGAAYLDEHAAARDKTLQGYLLDQIAAIKQSDPRQQGFLGRFGEFLSALAANGNLSEAGQVESNIRQRDLAAGREIQNEMFQANVAGLESGDQAAAAHAGSLGATHAAQEQTAVGGYGRGVTQAQINAGVAEANAHAGAETARARAAAVQALAEMTAQAQARAQQERSQALGILAQNPTYSDQAATAMAGDISQGHTGMVGPMAQAVEARQYHNGLAGMVRALAGQQTNSPMYTSVMQALQRIFPAMNAQMLQGATQNPEGFAEFILQQPTAMQVIQSDPALRRQVLGYAAGVPAPAPQ